MTEYQILSKCLDDHCISDTSELVYICKQVLKFDVGRMGSKARVGVKLKCPVPLLNKFFDEYDHKDDFDDCFDVRCESALKEKSEWHTQYQKAYESDQEFAKYKDIGPVFECSRVYSLGGHHIVFVSAWYDPKMGFSGFYYYTGECYGDLEFQNKHLCSIS